MDSLPYIQDLDPREAGPVDDAIEVATTALMSAHCDDQEGDLHIWQASECHMNTRRHCGFSIFTNLKHGLLSPVYHAIGLVCNEVLWTILFGMIVLRYILQIYG